MAHSFAQSPSLQCPQCGAAFDPEIWLIIDAAERPELLARAADGSIHAVACPNGHAGEVDAPLLLYRPGETPPLVFSPAQQTTAEQDREIAGGIGGPTAPIAGRRLAGRVAGRLRRRAAPIAAGAAARRHAAALQEALAEAIPPGVQQVLAEIAAMLEAEGVALESPEDLERALESRPELRARLAAALGEAAGDGEGPPEEAPDEMALPPAAARLLSTLQQFIETPNWVDSYRFLTAHPELLSDDADGLLSALLDGATADENENAVRIFGEHRELLRRSRAADAAAAFAEKLGMTAEQLAERASAAEAMESIPPATRRALAEVMAALAAEGVSVNSPDELQAALAARPELQAKLDAALGGGQGGPDVPPEYRDDLQRANTAEQRYRATGDRAALDEAAAAWQRILTHPGFPAAPERFQLAALNDAGGVFLRRYWAGGRLADLDRALALWQDAVGRTPADSPDRASIQNNLGNGLRARYARTGRVEDLDAAIAAYEDAVGRTPADSPDRASLSEQPGQRAARPLRADGAGRRPGRGHRRLRGRRGPHPGRLPRPGVAILNNLGNGLRARYARTGRVEDLDAAIAAYEDAVSRTPADSPDRASLSEQPGHRAARPLRADGAGRRPGRGHRRLRGRRRPHPGRLPRPGVVQNNLGTG